MTQSANRRSRAKLSIAILAASVFAAASLQAQESAANLPFEVIVADE